jgi:hypothetical protein
VVRQFLSTRRPKAAPAFLADEKTPSEAAGLDQDVNENTKNDSKSLARNIPGTFSTHFYDKTKYCSLAMKNHFSRRKHVEMYQN